MISQLTYDQSAWQTTRQQSAAQAGEETGKCDKRSDISKKY